MWLKTCIFTNIWQQWNPLNPLYPYECIKSTSSLKFIWKIFLKDTTCCFCPCHLPLLQCDYLQKVGWFVNQWTLETTILGNKYKLRILQMVMRKNTNYQSKKLVADQPPNPLPLINRSWEIWVSGKSGRRSIFRWNPPPTLMDISKVKWTS